MLDSKTLSCLADTQSWQEIIDYFENSDTKPTHAAHYFYVATAYIKKNKLLEADSAICCGLKISPQNSWGRHLKYDVDKTLLGVEVAQNELFEYLTEHGSHRTLSSTFINQAVSFGDFDRAKRINEDRDVILKGKMRGKYAIALQTFCKADTLQEVLESLLKCNNENNFHLYIIQDVPNESHASKYQEGFQKVQDTLVRYMPELMEKFEKLCVVTNKENLGTAPTCRKILDIICCDYDGFLFLEDDCVITKDALQLAKYLLENKIGLNTLHWFGSCESTFFNNAEGHEINLSTVKDRVIKQDLHHALYDVEFVPSTCFITRKEVWEQLKEYRSFPKGPESLTAYINTLGKKTILPVVPRARDVGMTHELGYSVLNLGSDGVKERKAHYLDSDQFELGIEFWFHSKF